MPDPFITAAIIAGAKKLGAFATDWVRGEPPQQLAAALADRVSEDDFQLLSFETLAKDEDFWDLVDDARRELAFDEVRAAEIVGRHVDDLRGPAEFEALVKRIVTILRNLLPAVLRGGSEALSLQAALQHQDAIHLREAVEANREELSAIHEAIAGLAATADTQQTGEVIVLDQRWLTGRASESWSRLVEADERAAAELKEGLGEKPTAARVRAYVAELESAPLEVWETVVAIVDELGDAELLGEVALRYADSGEADRVRGLAWAASAANQRGDDEATLALLEEARQLNPDHPSLHIVQAQLSGDAAERLSILEGVEPQNERQGALLESLRAHAQYELGDTDGAFASVARAKAADPGDLLAAEVEAALIVADARAGKGLTWQNAERAIDDLGRVREALTAARRFDLSAAIAGKMSQVQLLFGGGLPAVREIVASLAPEEHSRDEAALLAATLVHAGDPEAALALLPSAPEDAYSRFVLASALLRVDRDRFREEGIPILDELLQSDDDELRKDAAWMRAGASLLDPPLAESEEALRVLDEHDPLRARIHRAAAAERSDPAEAEAILAAGGEQPELLIERGRLAANRDDWPAAIVFYRRATQLDPTPINKLALADSLRASGDVEGAQSEALAIARRGEYPPHLRNTAYRLAYGLTQRSGDLDAQADLAEEWLEFDDTKLELVWSYIWALARLSRYQTARSVIDRRGLWPAEEQDAELYADVLIHTATPEEALETLFKLSDQLNGEVAGIEGRLMMLALSVDPTKVPQKLMERAAERLQTYPQRFPNAGVQQFEVDPADPLREIRPILESRARATSEISEALTRGAAPLAALAALSGRDVGTLLLGLNVLPLGFGNADIDATELEDARRAPGNPVVWESTAINIAGGLGRALFNKIRAAFQIPTVAQAVVDDARAGAHDAMAAVPTGTLGVDPTTGEAFYHQYEPGELEREQHRAKTILELLDGLTVVPNIDEAHEGDIGKQLRETGHLDNPALATVEATLAVAERMKLPVYSDDPVIRTYVRGLGVGAFGTPSLLHAMVERGMVDQAELDGAVATLLRSGAQGIPADLFNPIAAARAANWGLTNELGGFLLDGRRWNNDLDANVRRWHEFLRVAAKEASTLQFRRWLFRVVDAMILALPENEPEQILALAAAGALTVPVNSAEEAYRRQLVRALDSIRQFYGVKKDIVSIVIEWQAQYAASLSIQPDEAEPTGQGGKEEAKHPNEDDGSGGRSRAE